MGIAHKVSKKWHVSKRDANQERAVCSGFRRVTRSLCVYKKARCTMLTLMFAVFMPILTLVFAMLMPILTLVFAVF